MRFMDKRNIDKIEIIDKEEIIKDMLDDDYSLDLGYDSQDCDDLLDFISDSWIQ